MCYVPQVANVFTWLTVEENLEMGGFVLKGDLEARKDRVYGLFPQLRERRRQRAGKMSGGERQMVAMGSALMLDPQLLLLDEPSAGLSPKMVEMIFERIEQINASGPAILIVEQNARLSLQMADRGYVLANGENRFEGTGQDLLNDSEVGRLYLGG
jgi:ABC-type branched-subunit amino acid transport system ATPase component